MLLISQEYQETEQETEECEEAAPEETEEQVESKEEAVAVEEEHESAQIEEEDPPLVTVPKEDPVDLLVSLFVFSTLSFVFAGPFFCSLEIPA